MQYNKAKHCAFYHRYHVVWLTKYRFKVLRGDIEKRVREIIHRVCAENGVDIISGVVSNDHVHIFISMPPKISLSDLMRKIKGRFSYLMRREFLALKKRYWGHRSWGRGYFRQQMVPSQKMWYFSALKTTSILPTKVGSSLVKFLGD